MSCQFISKIDRIDYGGGDNAGTSAVGPGSYEPSGSSLKKTLPGFVPFSSSSKRGGPQRKQQNTPGPMDMNVTNSWASAPQGSVIGFKSKTERFKDDEVVMQPGPGAYSLPSAIQNGKPRQYAKPSNKLDTASLLPTNVPSIPTRFQSYGYESGNDGKLTLQDSVKPGFTGDQMNAVGPLEYDPNIDIKFGKNKKAAQFSQGVSRSFDVVSKEAKNIPGPGYYNSTSCFTDYKGGEGGFNGASTDPVYLAPNVIADRHPHASFESKTKREFLPKEADVANLPGPGSYDLPNTIAGKVSVPAAPSTVPSNLQCFSSSDTRFKETQQRSLRTYTAPGSYDPLTSDFDKTRLKILKHKKMSSRSGWAQNIAFSATENRFHKLDKKVVPPPDAYRPRTDMRDHIPEERGLGPFGCREKRFNNFTANKNAHFTPPNDASTAKIRAQNEKELTRMKFVHEMNSGGAGDMRAGGHGMRKYKPTFTSNFSNNESRFVPIRDPLAPPPGSYNLELSWKGKGGATMKEHKMKSAVSKDDYIPGPGEYNLAKELKSSHNNKKNVLFTCSNRFDVVGATREALTGPSPMAYNPFPTQGTLLRPSHNILLSNGY